MELDLLENEIGNIGKWKWKHWKPENDNFRYIKHWLMELESLENGIGN